MTKKSDLVFGSRLLNPYLRIFPHCLNNTAVWYPTDTTIQLFSSKIHHLMRISKPLKVKKYG